MFGTVSLHARRVRAILAGLLCGLVLTSSGSIRSTGADPLPPTIDVWQTLTTDVPANGSLIRAAQLTDQVSADTGAATIDVDDSHRYQTMVGFGGALTDSSAWLIGTEMTVADRDALLHRLFSRSDGIGLSFLRLPMGASDYTQGSAYTYDDLPPGQTDYDQARFSVAHDDSYIVPTLKEMLALNPQLEIVAAPWSPPAWMKDDQTLASPEQTAASSQLIDSSAVYSAYALYFTRFVQAYAARGIPIALVSPQNEPGTDLGSAPWSYFAARDEVRFVRDYLGPALAQGASGTGIVVSDDVIGDQSPLTMVDYANRFQADPEAWRWVVGTAAHCYYGFYDAARHHGLTYPGKDAYVTECSGGIEEYAASGKNNVDAIIDSLRAGARGVLLWNLALDTSNGPIPTGQVRPYGCNFPPAACPPIVTIGTAGTVTYRPDYYYLAQFSRFVPPGSVRVEATSSPAATAAGLEQVGFRNPDGSDVVVAYNPRPNPITVTIRWNGYDSVTYTIPGHTVCTFQKYTALPGAH